MAGRRKWKNLLNWMQHYYPFTQELPRIYDVMYFWNFPMPHSKHASIFSRRGLHSHCNAYNWNKIRFVSRRSSFGAGALSPARGMNEKKHTFTAYSPLGPSLRHGIRSNENLIVSQFMQSNPNWMT